MAFSTQFPSKSSTREKGKEGESHAEKFLLDKGFKIIKRNFNFGRYGEIDIIAEDGEYLVFVEVKTRRTEAYGDPIELITPQKINKLRRAAEGYLYVNKIYEHPCRFDVITIDYTKSSPTIRHIINAF